MIQCKISLANRNTDENGHITQALLLSWKTYNLGALGTLLLHQTLYDLEELQREPLQTH